MKYSKVVSGGEFMNTVLHISRGHRATIEAPLLIFSNESRSYSI